MTPAGCEHTVVVEARERTSDVAEASPRSLEPSHTSWRVHAELGGPKLSSVRAMRAAC
jgi:hypothetical protein